MSKTIYYACKYAPLELFAGYGATFSALDPLAESFSCAERCAHANLCGYAKAVLEQVEQSGIRALVLTNCCDAMLRVYDVLAASGKMEFLLLLPQNCPAGVESVIRRVQNAVQAARVPSHPELRLSVSIGGVCNVQPLTEAIRQADARMYCNKENGEQVL